MRMSIVLKILIPAVLLLALFVALLVMFFFEQPPANAQAGAIEARFGEQLAELQTLAEAFPVEECGQLHGYVPGLQHRLGIASTPEAHDTGKAHTQAAAWRTRVEKSLPLFDDSVILGGGWVFDCDGSSTVFEVKPYYDWRALSRTMVVPPTEWPMVSISYVGRQRVIYYQNQIEDDRGIVMRFHLIIDLEGLEED